MAEDEIEEIVVVGRKIRQTGGGGGGFAFSIVSFQTSSGQSRLFNGAGSFSGFSFSEDLNILISGEGLPDIKVIGLDARQISLVDAIFERIDKDQEFADFMQNMSEFETSIEIRLDPNIGTARSEFIEEIDFIKPGTKGIIFVNPNQSDEDFVRGVLHEIGHFLNGGDENGIDEQEAVAFEERTFNNLFQDTMLFSSQGSFLGESGMMTLEDPSGVQTGGDGADELGSGPIKGIPKAIFV